MALYHCNFCRKCAAICCPWKRPFSIKISFVLDPATITPAKYLDADESLGTIAAGKLADLVLLSADPLENIDNTRKIAAVILGGKYLSRARLNSMLAPAADAPK